MKSLPIALDRLLANPSFERIDGKLIKVSDDGLRAIIELKNKKLRTLLGPFADASHTLLADKTIVAFVKAGEVTRIFDARQLPRERKAVTAKAGVLPVSRPATSKAAAPKRNTTLTKPEASNAPRVKWLKYAESRMVGEPVKLLSMERGFGLDLALLHRILEHLGVAYMPVTKSIAYLDFRKVFHFICEPAFKVFLNGYVPMPAPPKASVEEADEEEDEEVDETED